MDIVCEKQAPTILQERRGGVFADFGKDAFGRLEYAIEATAPGEAEIVVGEVLGPDGRIVREPGGFRICRTEKIALKAGVNRGFLHLPKHRSPYQGTQRSKVPTPPACGGEIEPFRYAEVWGTVASARLTRHAFWAPFDDQAASFECSDDRLNRVWEFCKYTMKATSVFGLYVDGERERQCFEGDAYINALGAYCTGGGYEVARRTLDFLIQFYPITVVEYQLLTPRLVHDYFLYSGDTARWRDWGPEMPSKLMPFLISPDGLFRFPELLHFGDGRDGLSPRWQYLTTDLQEYQLLVDWPWDERDHYEYGEFNFTAQAFYYDALRTLAELDPQGGYGARAALALALADIRRLFWRDGLYRDSWKSGHTSLHTAMFALAMGVATPEETAPLLEVIRQKGMACSVYGAQFLLDACFANGAEQHAIDLMRSEGPRSWLNMLAQGATMTMEAWDNETKPNQDWNHAWGAAPANLIPRRLCGVRPVANGFREFVVDPKPGDVRAFRLVHPTPHGPITVEYEIGKGCEVKAPAECRRVKPRQK